MKERNEFDFDKHYGDERETPPPFFWDDLENQIPKKRKKRAAIFWVSGIAALAASILLATWGINYFTTTNDKETITTTTTKQVEGETNNTPSLQKENSTQGNNAPITTDVGENHTAKNTQQGNGNTSRRKRDSTPLNKQENTPNQTPVRLYTHDKENILPENHKHNTPYKEQDKTTPEHNHEPITLPIAEIEGDKWVEAKVLPQDSSNNSNNNKGCKYIPNFYVAFSSFAHTHTFSNFNNGASIGLGIIKKINTNWEARIGLNYMQIENPGLKRSSTREHYFVTKTTTTQNLEINRLGYLTLAAKAYYKYNKWSFFGGIETLMLINSKASLRTTEVSYTEERVTEKEDLVGYTKGVNNIVPQLTFGAGLDINKRVRAELQFSHSILPYGSQSLFTTNNRLKLSYVGLGINWRIN